MQYLFSRLLYLNGMSHIDVVIQLLKRIITQLEQEPKKVPPKMKFQKNENLLSKIIEFNINI